MRKTLLCFSPRQAIPRIIADFAIVQASAILSLAGTFAWLAPQVGWENAPALAGALERFYLRIFLPLSAVFPVVFLLNGIYTRSRGYSGRYKLLVVLRASAAATLVFLFLNFLLSREAMMPRSAALIFAAAVLAGTVGVRWARTWGAPDPAQPARFARRRPRSAPVLVVGGGGYIGSILCRKLLDSGERVRVLDSLVYGDFAIRELLLRDGFELIPGDCRDIRSVVSAMRDVRSVVHLAAIVGDGACERDRRTALEVNYAATRMMIEVAKGNGVERFVFASSCSVYGATDLVMDERSAVQPVSLYGQTKVDSERVLLESATADFRPVALRLATVFGAGYRPRFDLVVNLLAAKAHYEGAITIFGGGQWRPFIHVRDVAAGIVLALEIPLAGSGGEVFNLGDSRLNYTLNEVAGEILRVFPGTRVVYADISDHRNYRVSFDRIRGQLGFECILGLGAGIQELKRSFQRNAIPDYTDVRYNNQRFLEVAGSAGRADPLQGRVMAAFAGD